MGKVLSVNPAVFKKRNESTTLSDDQGALLKLVGSLNEWGISPNLWVDIMDGISPIEINTPRQSLTTKLTPDQRERLCLIASYDNALKALFVQEQHRREWIHNKHKSLDGYSPLDVMTCGSLLAMYELNSYLQGLFRS
ncbi:hypothetical protein CWE15_11730 [Aliidiomarina taiwanensis]|uniref:Antitoxin Xre/MbcA/ParS-like toxin-binding domain-containing protein n=1 Tax=Aliidiomarina taiwanensis TaxID=946228 RepID=A0A432WTG8_9GAMM|nr:hypothetical protein [Aliidiomarina taiwanensis]RUO37071.1 hypothetical protein CWE15_11730 [Aliidiomarina taiwanensis]